MNEARIKACINKFDSGAYDRLQFLKTVSHSLGAHTPSLYDSSSSAESDDDDDDVEVPQPPSPTDAAGTPTTAASTTSSSEVADCCEVCLRVPWTSVTLVPCGHSRFCLTCADTVAAMGNGCPHSSVPLTYWYGVAHVQLPVNCDTNITAAVLTSVLHFTYVLATYCRYLITSRNCETV